ncbi:MAG: Fimbrial assembly protein (PilN) [Syntrophaceae bacterium PtaU1.Bin231]|nr:MAG: Fimbrial assembly protein (PilN) [Syntrophaceae bacterium PtaU1.Bin231]HOG17818.1 PilN domain-containing protein [Syntrophales bacterium]
MIRINLLPYREKEKKANLARQLIIIGATFVVFLAILVSLYFYVITSVKSLEADIKKSETELARLTKVLGDIEVFKADKKVMEKKLAVIQNLEANRLAPVRLLDELAVLVPTKDIWLEKMVESGSSLRIEGVGRDNIVVALFMKNLERSDYIRSVDLVLSKQAEISGVKLQRFVLSCMTKKVQ